jgi:hypothetical protein
MAENIELNQVISGKFQTSDSKYQNGYYYDDYNLTGVEDFRQLIIRVEDLENGGYYSNKSIDLINSVTGDVIADTSDGSTRELARTTAPGVSYTIRVNGTTALGNYKLSVLDGGKATSIISDNSAYNYTDNNPVTTVGVSGRYFPLASGSIKLSDIALAPNGQLYGVTRTEASGSIGTTSALSIINPGGPKGSQVSGAIPLKDAQSNDANVNGLVAANNALYGIGDNKLYQIDVNSKVATLIRTIPQSQGFVSSGDLVYDAPNSRFLATSKDTLTSDSLWAIPLNSQVAATKIGPIGFNNVEGLSVVNGQLTGFTSKNSYEGSQIDINILNGQGSVSKQLNFGAISGASSLPVAYPKITEIKSDPGKFMGSIRDYDGNDLGGASSWKLLGDVDIQGDGDLESILVNPAIGRFASVGSTNGNVDFAKYGLNGDTRVVGIYIDPTLKNSPQNIGGPFDSQRRFQNDLRIDNLKLLAAGDYDKDGFQDMYFKLGDGSAVLRALMFKDGNIQYANYQSKADLTKFMTDNGVSSSIWGNWL